MQTLKVKLCTTAKKRNSNLEDADRKSAPSRKQNYESLFFNTAFSLLDGQTKSVKNVGKKAC